MLATALLGTVAAVATALGGATGPWPDGSATAPRAVAPCGSAEPRTVAWLLTTPPLQALAAPASH